MQPTQRAHANSKELLAQSQTFPAKSTRLDTMRAALVLVDGILVGEPYPFPVDSFTRGY